LAVENGKVWLAVTGRSVKRVIVAAGCMFRDAEHKIHVTTDKCGWNFDLFDYYDGRANFAGHHLQGFQIGF
jgi:hypothetical protein